MAKYRSVFISDVHLGTISSKARELHEFLEENTCENLYLVGDIVDGWLLKKNYFWPRTHSKVIKKFLSLAKEGTNVYYITGNHDDFLRVFTGFGLSFGSIKVYDEIIHETPDGERYLVVHGDMFDKLIDTGPISKFFGFIGSMLYHLAFNISMLVNFLFKPFKVRRWSLTATVKKLLRIDLLPFLTDYEKRMVEYVKRRECAGIICGHIHNPEIRDIGDVTYMNDGDWVKSKSALVENHDGTFELIYH